MDGRIVEMVDAVLRAPDDLRLGKVLQDVADTAREVIGVRYAAIGVLGEDGDLERFVHSGVDDSTAARIGNLPSGGGLLGWQSRHAVPLRLDDLASHPASEGFPEHHPVMTTFLSAPVQADGGHFGNLYMSDRLDGEPFDQDDQDLAVVLAALAGTAVGNVRRLSEMRRLSLVEDRERIGRDLHDVVIQRVFAAGLQLQGLARRVDTVDPASAARLNALVADLDETIRTIRSAIFSLSVDDPDASLTTRVRRLVGDEMAGVLGFTPGLELAGPLDEVDDVALIDEVVAVLREALTNVARHADASRADVQVHVRGTWLHVEVSDDGVGLPAGRTRGTGLGLRNLVQRAVNLGGEAALDDTADGQGAGARVVWRVPVTTEAD